MCFALYIFYYSNEEQSTRPLMVCPCISNENNIVISSNETSLTVISKPNKEPRPNCSSKLGKMN